MSPFLPALHFDTETLPPGEGFRLWAGASDYDFSLLEGEVPENFRARMTAWRVCDMLVTSGSLGGHRILRSAQRARTDGRDSFSFLLLTRGSWRGDLDGEMVTVGPGQICAFDFARPLQTLAADSDFVLVVLARASIETALPLMPNLHGRIFEGTTARLLAEHFLSLARFLSNATEHEGSAIANATTGLVLTCLASPVPEPKSILATGLRHRIRRYVDDHLEAADLSPQRIGRDLSLTRSTLYRALAPQGVASYVQGRRLEAAHALLNRPEEKRNVASIAHAFGFSSAAHFSTAFRRRFGYSPNQARSSKQFTLPDHRDSLTEFHAWLRALEAS